MAQVSVAWAISKEGLQRLLFQLQIRHKVYIFLAIGVSAPIVGSTTLANLTDAIGGRLRFLTRIAKTDLLPCSCGSHQVDGGGD